jgi:predicted enzyme related to lactoylglutathione lyase
MDARPVLLEFPADDPSRARAFWAGLLDRPLHDRQGTEGEGWQTAATGGDLAVGVHARGPGPGDRFSLPYLAVDDLPGALQRVTELGGSVVHPGHRYAVCRDSEGTPFGLTAAAPGGDAP